MLVVPEADDVDFVLSDGHFLEVSGLGLMNVLFYALLIKVDQVLVETFDQAEVVESYRWITILIHYLLQGRCRG